VLRRLKRRAEAREALDRAVTAFESLGSRLWAEQARAERARIGGRSRPSGLTPTESQVAALVADGSSNKEVAAALFVTVNTVEAHLSRVYKKLGVRSRNQLARALAEQGPGVSGLSARQGPA
jgi:DNA-binding CsgD family transcriptional regulator